MPDTIDISHWQGRPNFQAVAKSGVKNVFIKATNGAFQTDDQFLPNVSGAHSAGMRVGCYHFLLSDQTPESQADNFLNHISQVKFDLLPALDCEWDVRRKGEADRWLQVKGDSRIAIIGRFCQRVKKSLGVLPITYTATSWWRPMIGKATYQDINFSDCPLWIAAYTKVLGSLPAQWKSHAVWQYSGSGKVNGINGTVDLDRLNVPIENLLMPKASA
jgi:lysozyme